MIDVLVQQACGLGYGDEFLAQRLIDQAHEPGGFFVVVQRRFDKGLEFRRLVFLDAEGTVALFRDDAAFLRLVHDGVARDPVAELDGSQFLVRNVFAGLAENPLEFGFRDQHFACEQMAERFFLLFVDGLGEAKYEVPEFVKRGKSFALDGE